MIWKGFVICWRDTWEELSSSRPDRERGRGPKGAGTDVRNIQDGRLRIVYLNITEI